MASWWRELSTLDKFEPMKRDAILSTAADLIRGDRHADYGDFKDNAECLAGLWSAYLGRTIHPRDVAPMLALLKLMRLRHGPHRDSWIDLAGYAALGGEVDGLDWPDWTPTEGA